MKALLPRFDVDRFCRVDLDPAEPHHRDLRRCELAQLSGHRDVAARRSRLVSQRPDCAERPSWPGGASNDGLRAAHALNDWWWQSPSPPTGDVRPLPGSPAAIRAGSIARVTSRRVPPSRDRRSSERCSPPSSPKTRTRRGRWSIARSRYSRRATPRARSRSCWRAPGSRASGSTGAMRRRSTKRRSTRPDNAFAVLGRTELDGLSGLPRTALACLIGRRAAPPQRAAPAGVCGAAARPRSRSGSRRRRRALVRVSRRRLGLRRAPARAGRLARQPGRRRTLGLALRALRVGQGLRQGRCRARAALHRQASAAKNRSNCARDRPGAATRACSPTSPGATSATAAAYLRKILHSTRRTKCAPTRFLAPSKPKLASYAGQRSRPWPGGQPRKESARASFTSWRSPPCPERARQPLPDRVQPDRRSGRRGAPVRHKYEADRQEVASGSRACPQTAPSRKPPELRGRRPHPAIPCTLGAHFASRSRALSLLIVGCATASTTCEPNEVADSFTTSSTSERYPHPEPSTSCRAEEPGALHLHANLT